MKTDDIFAEWDIDSQIPENRIASESIRSAVLHRKYYRILFNEKLLLVKQRGELAKLRADKFEMYMNGPDNISDIEAYRGKGKKLRSDIPMYLDSDQDLIDMELKVANQTEKVELLKSIIEMIKARRWEIKNYIEMKKFESGND